MIKVGDYVTCRGMFGITLFAKVKVVEELDGGYFSYLIEGPEGEFRSYNINKLTQKDAKEWVKKFKTNIKFLEQIQ